MIVTSRATLAVYSDTVSAAGITAALGIEPTRSTERDDPTRSRWHWSLDTREIDVASGDDDRTGFEAVGALVDLLRGKEAALAALRPACETIIWWSGDSDSTQGGFVLPAELLSSLAALGCDLYGTTFLSEIDADDDDPEED